MLKNDYQFKEQGTPCDGDFGNHAKCNDCPIKKECQQENEIFTITDDDLQDFNSNLYCDFFGYCEGSTCPNWINCKGLHH